LSTNAGHSMRQFLFLADRMRHAGEYTPVVYAYTWVGYMHLLAKSRRFALDSP
jgi:hypothetical protein